VKGVSQGQITWHIDRAGPKAVLLLAAGVDGFEGDALFIDKAPLPFEGPELVARERKKIAFRR
jgi:hypothetical protein